MAQVAALQAWLDSHSALDIPPTLGSHRFTLGAGTADEVIGERCLFTYDYWMLQRALQVWAQANLAQRDLITALCERMGAEALLTLPSAPLVRREQFKLRRA